jgi:hypothetical protein
MSDMEFLDEIPINVPSALQQLLGRFQAVRDGLPELVKNAKDQYARIGVTERGERVIVVLVNSETRRLGVLDFAGATREDFVAWKKWADPYAHRGAAAEDIEGGHGNGGKGFMVRGSTDESFFESCRNEQRTKMGYSSTNEDRLYYPAFYAEGGKRVDDVKVKNTRKQLDLVLEGVGANFGVLPDAAKAAFEKRQAFSVVQVNGVRDWGGRRSTVRQLASSLPEEIVLHAQAALSVETCSVFFVIDGLRLQNSPLERANPEPMPGFEDLEPIPIPAKLQDPNTTEMIDTGGGDPATHYLQLRTSQQSLRIGNHKALNVVRVRNVRNIIGNWSVADLYSHATSAHVLGVLRVPSMGTEHQVGADRVSFADTPLVRALRTWTAEQVEDLASKIQKAIAKEHKPQELDKANDGLNKMRELMRQFLDDGGKTKGGKGENGPGAGPTPKPPGTIVRQIVLEGGAQSIALAVGTNVPLLLRAYDLSAEGEKLLVPAANLDLMSEPPGFCSLVGRRNLHGDAAGRAAVWFRDRTTAVESNRLEVEIVRATGAEIQELPSRLLLQGEEVPLRIVFQTARGARGDVLVDARADLLIDADVDEPLMGRVDRYGVFTAGGREGPATVRVRFGSGSGDTVVGTLQIGPNRVPKRPTKGAGEGPDLPLILLCGAEAPNMEHLSPDQRTLPPSEYLPTIIDFDPVFEPTIFINPDSKESFNVRNGRGGRRGMAKVSSQGFLQFLALKCFEILKRLHVRQSIRDNVASEFDFRQRFADAEMTCAPFVDQAFEIAHELTAAIRDPE